MAGNKKISQLVDGGAGQTGDNYVIERGGVNFKVDNASVSGNPGGLDLLGVVNDMIVKDEKSDVALEQRQVLPSPLSFVDNTAVPPTEVNDDIYLLDDTGASNAAWDGNPINTWVRFDGLAGTWKGIAPIDGMITTLQDTGFTRKFDPTSSTWETLGALTPPAGANTEIQFNNAGAFGASSLFTFSTAFTEFKCDANAVFNESGNNRDFRIESLTGTHSFFLDGTQGNVGFGDATPSAPVSIETASNTHAISIKKAAGTDDRFKLYLDATEDIFYETINADHRFRVGASERFTIEVNGGIGVNDTTPSANTFDIKLKTVTNQTGSGNPLHRFVSNDAADSVISFDTNNAGTNRGKIFVDHTNNNLNFACLNADIVFITGAGGVTERMRVEQNGNVGIGVVVPNELLEVAGKIRANTFFNLNGTDGISETLTFGGGASGEVATITFTGGIITARTLVP